MSQARKTLEKTPEIRAVLFDLDGTLLDTARDFWECLNQLRAEENLGPLSFEAVRCQVSHGGHALVRLGFGALPADAHEAMRVRLLDIYRQRLAKHTCLFEGGEEMLGEIERRGLQWGVVTNKPGWLTDPLMVAVNLQQRARVVVSGDTLPERKPHPLPLLHAAKTLGVEPHHCVYVGDAERDMQAAQAAGMYALVAGFGYLGDDDRADTWFSHGWLHTPLDLIWWLDSSNAGGRGNDVSSAVAMVNEAT
ncbi:MAG TPA: HAD-IA family hydrolase [Steroidobacteraceae bacterium]|nr:HAD-IA family hydrolase [Steroidobacteraceae bacterium]